MANDLNQCNFIGRLGDDPQIRYLPTGGAVANLTIACGWKSKDKEGVEWVKLVVYERLAEICGEYLKKGSKIFVSGKFKTRKWQDQQGVDRYTTEIVVNEMQMLDGKQDAPQQAQQSAPAQRQQPQQPSRKAPPAGYQGMTPQQPAPDFDDPFGDSIPF